MGLLSLASDASTSKGYGYYKGNLVLYVEKVDDNEYARQVQGSLNNHIMSELMLSIQENLK